MNNSTDSKRRTATKIVSQYNIEGIDIEINGREYSGKTLSVYIPVDEMTDEARNYLDVFLDETGLSLNNKIILRERIQENIEDLIINEFWNNRIIKDS